LKIYFFLIISIIIEIIRKKYKETTYGRLLYNMNLLGICVLIVLVLQTDSALILAIKRFHNYIFLIYILLIPYIINQMKFTAKSYKFINFCFSLLLIIMYIYTIIFNGEEIIPYQTNFNLF
jgi:hypothetical protein